MFRGPQCLGGMSCEVRGGNPRELKAEDLIFVPTVDLQSIKELPLGIQRKNGDYVRNFFFFLISGFPSARKKGSSYSLGIHIVKQA